MSNALDTVNVHTLTTTPNKHSTHHYQIHRNYIKCRKAYTTFRDKTSTQRQFKNCVPQGSVLSPTLFNIHTSDTPAPQAPVKLTTYADDITITSTHSDINIAKENIQSYLHKIHTWTRQTTSFLPQTRQHAPLHTRPSRIQHTT